MAASITGDGVVALITDASEALTSEQWARRAVDLAIELGASEIAVETYTAGTTYVRVLKDAMKRVRRLARHITVTPWRGKGDAESRSAAIRQAFEVGTCRIAGQLPDFETACLGWQSGQHQPDALAAAVIAHDRLVKTAGQQMHIVSPIEAARRARKGTLPAAPAWMTRRIGG
ncbi:hypothetical protein [Mycobacterium sp.]|uniref:hypothetical protein n=1 Tax=Mycobacterium sp. TaxID=1785 RepID=UPI002D1622CF|nr:hypothetical protein [Mycobacterium sp.]HTQ21339.1 hypothetical protein [Mycobacterium sp.]